MNALQQQELLTALGKGLDDVLSKDAALSDYMDRACYHDCVGAGVGGKLMSGMSAVFPEYAGAMPPGKEFALAERGRP